LQNLANIIIFVIILLSSRERTFARSKKWHWVSCGMHVRKNLLLKFGKYYHFVIIVINKIQQENAPSWCLFLSFFLEPKNHFFRCNKTWDHYALIFCNYSCKIILLFFYFTLHKSQKNSEKMDKKVCPKIVTPLPFWGKTRGTR
jgi:hypothetical protein